MTSDTEKRVTDLERRHARVAGLLRFVAFFILLSLACVASIWCANRDLRWLSLLLWLPAAFGIWRFDVALSAWLGDGR